MRHRLEIGPVGPDDWDDLARLFGPRGACAGCWCMYWLRRHREFEAGEGAGNRRALRALVASGAEPGLLARSEGRPIGWCAVAPRERYRRLETSRILRPVDEEPVWSVPCFFVARDARGAGLTVALLEAAAGHARARGARILEGYPVEPRERMAPAFAYTGLASAFRRAGFREVARRSETRPIMRRSLVRPHRGPRKRVAG